MKIYSSAFVLLFLPVAIGVAYVSGPLLHCAVATPQEHLQPVPAPTDAESMAFISSDAGNTWQEIAAIPTAVAQQTSTAGNKQVRSAGVIIATGQRGIKRSTDNGAHWEWVISEGGVGIDVAKINGGFAAITFNTQSRTRRIRVSYDGGITWQPIDDGLQPAQTSSNKLFTLASTSYSAKQSNNTPLPEEAMISSIIEVDGNFYCGHPKGVFKSADKGKTWQLLLPSQAGKVYTLSVSGKLIYAVPRNGGC